ncbi:type IX secretion system membrane protein PorP/SprF [Flaviaesturariibacter aridisoli]|uniref:Type IX secretion system membrane protein PorP/SprF n=2 Tax=Flaviaesturariibacter aridisoli TaxID=2545761 RepID=A0A4R4E3E6_9BACT|nr:type IX secretion system membrane protein PorP/SprF [Flaviaesturariibacter aridisoli]
MSMKRFFAMGILALALSQNAQGQVDPHFSQFFVFPGWVNPAFTGAFDGTYRVSGVFRSQWQSMAGGFKTVGFSAEANTNRNVALGVNAFQQTTGTGYTYQQVNASFAYNGVTFDPDGYKVLSFGLQAGFISRRFDASKFQTEDQWSNLTGYNSTIPSADLLTANSSSVFDASAGVMYMDLTEDKKINPYIGFAVHHLTSPEEYFVSRSEKTKMPMRLTGHVSLGINVSEFTVVTPSVLYLRQGTAEEQVLGLNVRHRVSDDVSLLGGASYRVNDAFVPFAGLQYGNFKIGASYDVNASDIGKNVAKTNSFEVSLSLIFNKGEDNRYLRCPTF